MGISRIHRLLRLITSLRSFRPSTTADLADTLGISRRTVFRDLNMLEPDPKFTLERYLGNAWGMIPEGKCHDLELRFEPQVAANVAEVNWHRKPATLRRKIRTMAQAIVSRYDADKEAD